MDDVAGNVWQALERGDVPTDPGDHGNAVQVDPIKPMLKAHGTKRLKLKCEEPQSNFAFKVNLRHYITESKGYDTVGRCRFTL